MGLPNSPRYETTEFITPGQANEIQVVDDHAYIADGDEGLSVIDISTPSRPLLIGSFDTPDYVDSVFIDGNEAYVVENGSVDSSLYVLDISIPRMPTYVTHFEKSGRSVHVDSTIVYWGSSGGWGQYYYRGEPPTRPSAYVRHFRIGDSPSMFSNENFLYVTDFSRYDGLIRIFDTTVAPELVGSVLLGDNSHPTDISVGEGYAYVSSVNRGLNVLDVKDPSAPSLVSSFDSQSPGVAVQISDRGVYLLTWDDIQLIDASEPPNFWVSSSYHLNMIHRPLDFQVSDEYAYIAGTNLEIVKLESPVLYPDRRELFGNTTAEWILKWPSSVEEPEVACHVTGGFCTVSSVDPSSLSATIEWLLPAAPGVHSISVAVGNSYYFISARDDVEIF